MNKKIKAVLPFALICAISFFIEIFLSNFVFLAYVAGNNEVNNYTPKTFTQADISQSDNSFAVDGLDFPIHSVSFSIKTTDDSARESLVTANFYIADENNTNAAGLARSERIAVGSEPRKVTAYVNSFGIANYIDITFGDIKNALTVSDVVINPAYEFSFDMLRFILICLMISAIYILKKGSVRTAIKQKADFGQAAIISVAVCCTASVLMWLFCLSGETGNYVAYPLDYKTESYSPYIQQFDAFVKGQLHLDIQPSAELLALENPYSVSERHGVSYLFDRAFFEGRYYSYFGIAPLLTVYLPFYLISGGHGLPTDSTVMAAFSVLTAIFLPLAVIEWSKLRKKSAPWLSAVCAAGAYFASMVLLIQRGKAPFYYIAGIAGMAFVSAFLFFMLKTVSSNSRAKKAMFLILAGSGFALAFLSRINSVLSVTFVIAAGIIMYAIECFKSKNIKEFIGNTAALGLPVVAAIVFSLCYNYARFGDPFQFGTDYQLTVANTSEYKFFLGGVIPAIFHYFIQPFVADDLFPYIQLDFMRFSGYGRALYIDSNFGIFAVPFMLSLLLSPVILKSKKVAKKGKILLSVSLASLFITAFTDLCLGGVIFRYTADILLLSALLSAIILLEICHIAEEKYGNEITSVVKKGIVALTAVTVIISFAVSASINNNLVLWDPDVHLAVRDFFVFWS